MISPLSLRSVASPVTGLAPVGGAGLSLALTQGAGPWSGISRVRLPCMAARSWLWRWTFSPLGLSRMGSMRSEYSTWLRRPAGNEFVNNRGPLRSGNEIPRKPTGKEFLHGLFVDNPLFGADGGFESGI